MQDAADAVDNGHEAGADGLEDGFDLLKVRRVCVGREGGGRDGVLGGMGEGKGLTHDTTAPILKVCGWVREVLRGRVCVEV